jgi:hypothetical protein
LKHQKKNRRLIGEKEKCLFLFRGAVGRLVAMTSLRSRPLGSVEESSLL